MAKYQLSVVLAAMRTERWLNLYESVARSFHGSWEIIFVGPNECTAMEQFDNVKFIKDYGSISRCQQIAIEAAEGEYLTWTADDGIFLEDKLDHAFDILKAHEYDPKVTIVGKYLEGDTQDMTHPDMYTQNYYFINHHCAIRNSWVPNDCYLLNMVVIPTAMVKDMGGLDCEFEACSLAFVDFSMRAFFYGIKPVFMNEIMYSCEHMIGNDGDHAPIHLAQINHDMPMFQAMWLGKIMPDRVKIPLDNWKQAPERWERRFGKA